jgi:hypothetical protein
MEPIKLETEAASRFSGLSSIVRVVCPRHGAGPPQVTQASINSQDTVKAIFPNVGMPMKGS